ETCTDHSSRDADRRNCDSDRRHIFNLAGVAEAPQFSKPALRIMATGWRLSGIYKFSSGWPLNIEAGSDRALTGINHQRANQVTGNPYGDQSGGPLTQYLNPAAFAPPDTGTIGNIGRNSIPGPGTWSFDVGLSRVFRFQETRRLEIRAEAYNVLNSFRPGCIAGTTGTASGSCPQGGGNTMFSSNVFGQIRNSLDPRIM